LTDRRKLEPNTFNSSVRRCQIAFDWQCAVCVVSGDRCAVRSSVRRDVAASCLGLGRTRGHNFNLHLIACRYRPPAACTSPPHIRTHTQYSTTVNSPHAHITDRDIGRATRVHVSAVGRRVPLQYQQMRFGGRYQQMRFGGRLLLWVRIGLACRTMTTTPRAGGLHRAIVGARVPQTGTFPAASPRAACRRSTRAT
jgi:hypothetical protein